MKKLYFFLIFNIIVFHNLFGAEIILKTLDKVYFHQFFINDLFPFRDSSLPILLDRDTRLKLLEEYDYDNGFINDICKVQIISGEYKGRLGYIRENNLALDMNLKENNIFVVIKDDKNFNDYRITEKNTKCQIISSEISAGQEILTLKIQRGEYKDTLIHIANKKYFRFIINKKAELYYYINKGYTIIEVLDSLSLTPIPDAIADSQYKSDNDGVILYKDFTSSRITVTKKDYIPGYICNIKENDKVILIFLTKINTKSVIRNTHYKFTGAKDDATIHIKPFSQSNLDYFCLPFVDNEPIKITFAFFIKSQDTMFNTKFFVKNQTEHQYLQYFNVKTLQWETISPQIDADYYHIIHPGYYRLIENNTIMEETQSILTINVNKINKSSSRIFIRNQSGTIIKQAPSNGKLNILKDKYEYLFFTPDDPLSIYQGFLYISKSKDSFDFPKITLSDEPKRLNKLYYNEWRRDGVFIYKHLIQKPKPLVEFLGNMTIYGNNNIKFFTRDYEMNGYFKRVEKEKLYIIITSISKKVINNNNKQVYFVSPSFFDTNFIIPVYYWQTGGVLKISFDCVYFLRKRITKQHQDLKDYILMDSYPFGNYAFPADKNNAKFTLFYDLVF